MKYAVVINTRIEMPKNSGNFINRNLLTIGDPCLNSGLFPTEIDRNVFRCNNLLLRDAYRVNNNELTKGEGRLVIGVLFPSAGEDELVSQSIERCTTGTERLLTPPSELVGGMGDIFVDIALINNDKNYTNTIEDLCN